MRQPSEKSYGTAVCFSGVFGLLGFQHFYLGRYLLGFLDLGLSVGGFLFIFLGETTESIILHTLLLHDGAPAEVLELLLPLSHSQIRHALHQLREGNLVKLTDDDHWRITLLGYPAVRGFMENEGYLVDAF